MSREYKSERSYKRAVALILLLSPGTVFAQALFAEANFSDQQYSALIENVSLEATELRSAFSGFQLYLVKARVLDVYYGELETDEQIDIQLNVSYLGMKHTLENMQKPYILSFCRSEDGVFYTNRDFLIILANEVNLKEFNRLRAEGTDFDGNNDCTSTNFDLEPVAIE